MFPIAILQGRLSPDTSNAFQFFPNEWQREFHVAAQMGLEGIEWLVAPKEWTKNPIFAHSWPSEVKDLETATGVPVTSICADWFMEHAPWGVDAAEALAGLDRSIECAKHTKNRLILIPLLEQNTIKSSALQVRTQDALLPFVPKLAEANVSIAFETELPAEQLALFVDGFQSAHVGVYYDIGNCTSYGFDCPKDIRALGHRLKGVHVKDRKRGTLQSVTLGTGDADFAGCIKALRDIGWRGSLVMQAWRGAQFLDDAAEQHVYLTLKQQEAFDA